jgi:hypothetical protein
MHTDTSQTEPAARIFKVVLQVRLTRNLVVGPREDARQVGERQAQVLDWRWEASGAQTVECRQIALPASFPGDPCYDIEYDQAYWGGLYSNVPDHVYIPVALIEAVGLEAAFEWLSGQDPVHIINSDSYEGELFTAQGAAWVEGGTEDPQR